MKGRRKLRVTAETDTRPATFYHDNVSYLYFTPVGSEVTCTVKKNPLYYNKISLKFPIQAKCVSCFLSVNPYSILVQSAKHVWNHQHRNTSTGNQSIKAMHYSILPPFTKRKLMLQYTIQGNNKTLQGTILSAHQVIG